ncbi:Solute:Sodium symporter family [Tribonema minus]|uniref:Solute:Sodium symporter family n=1 Tax=Tribonema minus TaxID=303371 RepID=A0A835Z361_9STRA|nr:Solute:Sodium symporter family [Tribonema minus]
MVIGIIGILVAAAYVLSTFEHLHPPPSVGFPGYIYPNQEVCDEYGGVLGSDGASCVYNETRWGSTGIDNGAWPFGDSLQVNAEMTSVDGLPPFPNAILFNWATIFVLAAGNLSAIDFQQRCMAATAPQTAARGCILAGVITLAVTLPVAYMGGLARLFYGPDSAYAAFEVNTCSAPLGLPTCAQWLPDPNAFLKLCATQFPIVLGAWGLIGIAAASMSTSAGALLAISTIMARNVGGKVGDPELRAAGFMLSFARAHVPVVITIGALIAAAYNETGYLLVVAFDIALSSTIAPLLAIVHAPNRITPSGGVVALLGGMSTRVILEFALPKDGSFVLPYGQYAYGYGEGQAGLPSFVDAPDGGTWNAAACDAPRLRDWTGLDSLVSPLVCTALLFGVSAWDLRRMRQGRPPLLSRLVPAHWLVPVVATRSSDCTATTEDPTKTQTATHSHLVLAPK